MRVLRGWAMSSWTASMVLMLAILSAGTARAALPPHVSGEVLIKYRPAASASHRAAVRAQVGGHRLRDLALIRAEQVRLNDPDVEKAIGRLRNHPLVEYVEPNYEVRALVEPNDPLFPQLHGLHNTGQHGGTPGADIEATLAWDIFTGDPNLRVGVVDTGVDFTHPDLAANIWTNPGEIPGNGLDDEGNGYVDDVHGYDFYNNDGNPMDDHSHGTHVSGTIAAIGNNGVGVAGINWEARIVAVKFLGSGGSGSISAAIQAIQYLHANGILLSNHSWGGPFSQAFLDAVNAAGADGHMIVAAAGNSSNDIDVFPTYPAAYDTPYRITVAASNNTDTLADFSNYGLNHVDLAAPGVDILSTLPGGNYGEFSGTSMAAPHVTGVMALVMGRFPSMTTLQARAHLLLAVEPVAAFSGITVTGGRLNAQFAVFEPDDVPPGTISDLTPGELGSNTVRLHWTATGDDGAVGRARRYELRYALSPITEATFAGAVPAPAPTPGTAGASETVQVGGLAFNTTYYFAVRAVDETQNPGPISNVATATTLGIPDVTATPLAFSHTLFTGSTATQVLTLRNDGQGTLDFSVPKPAPAQPASTIPSMEIAKGAPDPRVGPPVTQGTGGPDGGGYRWIDSDHAGGPSFAWADIAGVGQQVPIGGDDMTSAPIPMGMSFPYYGVSYSSVRVCTNGFISFTDGFPAYANQPLPSQSAPANMIAAFWDDLYVSGGQVWIHNDGSRFIISWVGVYHLGGAGPYTFQIILEPDGDILCQFLSMAPNAVSGATTGIQDGTRLIGLTTAFNTPYVHNGLAVRYVRTPDWLSAAPASGRIQAGQSAEVQLLYDTFGVRGGLYQSNVHVLSNDPDESPLVIPVDLTVIGAPDIRVSPTALDFGQLFVGFPQSRSFRVTNPGTDVLNVTSVTSSDPSLSPVPASFSIAPGDSQWVAATWAPAMPSALAATLTLASNDPNTPSLVVTATGSSVLPPQVAATPGSFDAALTIPESTSEVLHLTNTGNSPLIWSVVVGGPASTGGPGNPTPFVPPATTWPSDPRREHVPLNAMPVPPADVQNLPVVITDPVGDGGPVDLRYLRGDGAGQLRIEMEMAAAIDPGNFGGYLSIDTDQNPNTGVPPIAGAPGQDIGTDYVAVLFYLGEGVVPVFRIDGTHMGDFPVQLNGNVARMAIPLGALGGDDGTVDLAGVIGTYFGPTDWFPDSGHGTIYSAAWLTTQPVSGTLAPGQTIDVLVSMATADLIGGTYRASLNVLSNDPDDGQVVVPVTLVAIGIPDIAMPPGLNFGTLLVGNTRDISLDIRNTGTDSLRITAASFDHPSFSFVGPDPLGVIAPGDSITRVVRFAPVQVCQPCTGTLSLVSNDPDENPALLPLMGTGNPPPDLDFSPSALSITLPIPGTGSRPLTIANLGTGPMTYRFPISDGAAAQMTYPDFPLTKGAIDPRAGVLGQGGPDGFGYRWRDSDEPAGPAFAWVDIVGSGQPVPIQGDDAVSNLIPMGMSFPYYGGTYSALYVSTNGLVSFTTPTGAWGNQPLPSPFAPPAIVCPFWDDLYVENTNKVWVRADGSRFIVSWVDVRHLGGDGPYTFQVILDRSGRITFQYLDMTPNANAATVGMQDEFGSNGLTVAFNSPYVHDGLAVQLSRFPSWLSASPASGTVAPGASVQVQVGFDTQGLLGGDYDDVLTLETNDPDEEVTHIPVNLTAVGIPDVEAVPTALDFGEILERTTRDLPLRLFNAGSDDLHLGPFTFTDPNFVFASDSLPPGATLAPGETLIVVVRFAPPHPCAPCTGVLSVASNDPDENPIAIALTGIALPAPAIDVDPAVLVATQPIGTVRDWPITISNPGAGTLSFSFPDFSDFEPAQVDSGMVLERGQADPRPGVLGQGGPDGFGYRWRDSHEPGGPVFQWINIVGTGTRLPFQYLDQNIPGVPIGFAFPFYQGTFSTVNVCTHGWFSFTSPIIQWSNQPLPSLGAPENLVAPFWDDLYVPAGGQVWYQATPTRFVITWLNVPRTEGGGPETFQAILYPSGRIVFQYLNLQPPTNQCTVGIQNQTRSIGLTTVFNAPYLHNSLAIEFTRVPSWLTVSPVSGSVPPGGSQVVQARITTEAVAAGIAQETLQLQSNVPDDGLRQIPVYLNAGVTPNLSHAPAADFGVVYIGYPESISVPVQNIGNGVLHLESAQVSGEGYSQTSGSDSLGGVIPAILMPGAGTAVGVSFAPQAPCTPCPGSLALASNDPDTPLSTMALTAQGLPPPVIEMSPDSLVAATANTLGNAARERLRTLLIRNTGGSDLTFAVQAELNPPVDSLPYQPAITSKGEVDTNPGVLGSGGPDQFGYVWRDSDEPAGPVFDWVDITGVGTVLPIVGDDQTQVGVPIGFPFPFYGGSFSTVNVCTNGFMSFTNPTTQYWHLPLPFAQAPENLLAAWWSDLYLASPRIWVHNDGSRFIVSWVDVRHLSGVGHYSFQIILYPNGRYRYQYLSMSGVTSNATIGIQDGTRTDGLTVAYNSPYVHSGLVVEFGTPARWLSADPPTGVVPPGGSMSVQVRFEAEDVPDGDHRGWLQVSSTDPARPSIVVPCGMHVGVVAAMLGVDPNALNRDAQGNWVTMGFQLPAGLDVHQVVPGTLRIQRALPIASGAPISYPDLNLDGVAEMEIKFDRAALVALLPDGDAVPVEICGEVDGVTWFQAFDAVRLFQPGGHNPGSGQLYQAGSTVNLDWSGLSGTSAETYDLWYSSDGGASWTLVEAGMTETSYAWTVPLQPTNTGDLQLVASDGDGHMESWISQQLRIVSGSVAVESDESPARFALEFDGPSPARGAVDLKLAVPAAAEVKLDVFDLRGARVRELAGRPFAPGWHKVRWDGTDTGGHSVAPGVYFLQLKADGTEMTKRVTLLK